MQQKVTIAEAVVLAVLLAFLLVGVSFILLPDQTSQPITPTPIPKPEPLLNQILWAFQWIGLAALVAISAVGAVLLINRVRHR
jgi:hypothetical protein